MGGTNYSFYISKLSLRSHPTALGFAIRTLWALTVLVPDGFAVRARRALSALSPDGFVVRALAAHTLYSFAVRTSGSEML